MKVKDLMIGDLIKWNQVLWTEKDGSRLNPLFAEVRAIGEHYIHLKGLPAADISELEPIPLTPEILENNFGEKVDGEYFSGNEYYEIYIKEISDSIWKVDYDCVEMNGIPRQSNNVCFVHELQHALRLFGLFEFADCFSV